MDGLEALNNKRQEIANTINDLETRINNINAQIDALLSERTRQIEQRVANYKLQLENEQLPDSILNLKLSIEPLTTEKVKVQRILNAMDEVIIYEQGRK